MSIKMQVLMVLVMCGFVAGSAHGGVVMTTSFGDDTPFGSFDSDASLASDTLTPDGFLFDDEMAKDDASAPEIVVDQQGSVWMRLKGNPDAPWINVTDSFNGDMDGLSGLLGGKAGNDKGFTNNASSDNSSDLTPGFTAGRLSSLAGGSGSDSSDRRYSRLVQLSALSLSDEWLPPRGSGGAGSLPPQSCPAMVGSGATSQFQSSVSGAAGGWSSDGDAKSNKLGDILASKPTDPENPMLPEDPIVPDDSSVIDTPILMSSMMASVALSSVALGGGAPVFTSTVPEPMTLTLLGLGGLALLRRKR